MINDKKRRVLWLVMANSNMEFYPLCADEVIQAPSCKRQVVGSSVHIQCESSDRLSFSGVVGVLPTETQLGSRGMAHGCVDKDD